MNWFDLWLKVPADREAWLSRLLMLKRRNTDTHSTRAVNYSIHLEMNSDSISSSIHRLIRVAHSCRIIWRIIWGWNAGRWWSGFTFGTARMGLTLMPISPPVPCTMCNSPPIKMIKWSTYHISVQSFGPLITGMLHFALQGCYIGLLRRSMQHSRKRLNVSALQLK